MTQKTQEQVAGSELLSYDEHAIFEIRDPGLLENIGGGDGANVQCPSSSNDTCVNVNNACGSDVACGSTLNPACGGGGLPPVQPPRLDRNCYDPIPPPGGGGGTNNPCYIP